MKESKLQTITNLFKNIEIRGLWGVKKKNTVFLVIDVCEVLSESRIPRNY